LTSLARSGNEGTLQDGERVTAVGRPARKLLGLYIALLKRADGTVPIDELVE
jgi:hypothetical protein